MGRYNAYIRDHSHAPTRAPMSTKTRKTKTRTKAEMQAATAETMLPVDPECAAEPDLTAAEFASLVASIKATNGPIHPIVVWGDPLAIIAGRHRGLACIEAGVPFGTYRVFIGDAAAKSAFITADNDHRRHMSIGQRRDKATARLKANPETSNRQIGLAVGLDDKTVASIRADLEARSEIPNVSTRIDTDNRKQAARKSKKASAKKTDTSAKKAKADRKKEDDRGTASDDPAPPTAPEDDDDTLYWSYYPTQFDNVDWQLDHITKDLRETTDLSTIEADDRTKAIERLERVITKARGCINALETNDKEHLDPDHAPTIAPTADNEKLRQRITDLESKLDAAEATRVSLFLDKNCLKLENDALRKQLAAITAPPTDAPPTVPADDDGPAKVDRKVINKALKKVGNDQRKVKPSDVMPRS
jgi:ParB-like chromosome segregation protein Spo0J